METAATFYVGIVNKFPSVPRQSYEKLRVASSPILAMRGHIDCYLDRTAPDGIPDVREHRSSKER